MTIERNDDEERAARINGLLKYLDLSAKEMIELAKQAAGHVNEAAARSKKGRANARARRAGKKR